MVDLKLECLTHGKVHVEDYFAGMKLGTLWENQTIAKVEIHT